ncbi:unnamed protein product [Linum trigynum]|uniref:Uncharacterized protein n=1 Tax=Linum trigynum TaxID=586398 RepID=A0AAV2D6D9_9ROSI
MVAFTSYSVEPCYTPLPDPNYQLRLLVEQFVRDTKRYFPKIDLIIKSIVPLVVPHDPSFLCESEETVPHSAKQIERVDQVCAQLTQDHLYVTESSRDDHDQECPVVADHTEL